MQMPLLRLASNWKTRTRDDEEQNEKDDEEKDEVGGTSRSPCTGGYYAAIPDVFITSCLAGRRAMGPPSDAKT